MELIWISIPVEKVFVKNCQVLDHNYEEEEHFHKCFMRSTLASKVIDQIVGSFFMISKVW